MTEKAQKRLTPREFWLMAAMWGSAMTAGDPGSCLYGFDETGLVQSEEHRRSCIDYIEDINQRLAKYLTLDVLDGDSKQRAEEIRAMLAYLETAPVEGEMPEIDRFTISYIEAAMWSTNDESDEAGGLPMDSNYAPPHIAPDALRRIISDCAHFQATYGHLLTDENIIHRRGDSEPLEMAGHDFWLTRNGHGAGFWEFWGGDWSGRVENILTAAAKSYGEVDLYVGDDGRIYHSGGIQNPEPIAALALQPRPSP